MTIHSALEQATRAFAELAIGVPRLTAEVLLAHALGRERSWLFAHSSEELPAAAERAFDGYVVDRLAGKPTQYITGVQEFYGRKFKVTPDVLIPRPETEHVIETALEKLGAATGAIIDVGCGSGAIATTLALELSRPVLATDISLAALRVAGANARRLGARVTFAACDLLAAARSRCAALIASNPPYVPETDQSVLQREVVDNEPHVALFGGPDGLSIYRRLIPEAARVLVPGGWLVMEVAYNSEGPVHDLLARAFDSMETHTDLAGLPRVVAARLRE
jgi:release factor glutamine methyltransferase